MIASLWNFSPKSKMGRSLELKGFTACFVTNVRVYNFSWSFLRHIHLNECLNEIGTAEREL